MDQIYVKAKISTCIRSLTHLSADLVPDSLDPGRQEVHDLLLRWPHYRRIRPVQEHLVKIIEYNSHGILKKFSRKSGIKEDFFYYMLTTVQNLRLL